MRPILILAAMLSLALAGPSLAAAARRPPPPPQKPAAAPAKPQMTVRSKVQPLAGALVAPPAFSTAPGLAALGLDQNRLDAQRLGPADAGPGCRSACASRRYMCGTEDETCSENWRQCVLACR
jgi:hypothetical protein